jgi:hypothetical protein
MKNPRLFETLWDWLILLALVAFFYWLLWILAVDRPTKKPNPLPDPRDEIRDLRSRIEALERRLP